MFVNIRCQVLGVSEGNFIKSNFILIIYRNQLQIMVKNNYYEFICNF